MSTDKGLTAEFFNSDDITKEGRQGVADKICDAANGVRPMLDARPSQSGGLKL